MPSDRRFAVGYYGYPRATNDIDVWVARTESHSDKLVATLAEFGFGTPELKPELFLKPNCIVWMGVPPMRVEILTSISGVEFEECYQARLRGKLDGVGQHEEQNIPRLKPVAFPSALHRKGTPPRIQKTWQST